MNDGAAFLTDRLIGDTPVRQWVLSLPHPLRYLLAYDSAILGEVVGAFVRAVFQHLRWKAKDLLGLRSLSLAHPGAVTVVQRCSGDLSLNTHFHSLVTDGVFVEAGAEGTVTFHALPPPTDSEVADVAWETCRRTRTILIRHGRWKDDLDEPGEEDTAPEALADLYAASLRGILVFGARRGQRAVRFFGQAAPRWSEEPRPRPHGAFDVHARQAVHAGDRAAVERLARYVLRPPLSGGRLERRDDGQIAITLKRAWRDGTAGVLLDPLELVGRLAALVPQPRTNTIRFHGVYAPHARLRKLVVPAGEPEKKKSCPCAKENPVRRDGHLAWAELMARVWEADVFQCPRCHAHGMQRIAIILDHDVVRRILRAVGLPTDPPTSHPRRPADELFVD